MSRVANNPVSLPSGVEVNIQGQACTVKGSKGSLSMDLHPSVELTQEDGTLRLGALHYTTMEEIDRTLEALHRLSRP